MRQPANAFSSKRRTSRRVYASPSNQSYQLKMVDSLVASMGLKDALDFAVESGWTGIADRITRRLVRDSLQAP